MDTWKLTGRTRHRLMTKRFSQPVFVLQVEIEVEMLEKDPVKKRWFIDAEAHHLNLTVVKSNNTDQEVK